MGHLSQRTGVILGPDVPLDESASGRLEWVVGNGRGGYGTGTVSGRPTRRYHGLLVVPLFDSARRYCLVGHLGERVSSGATGYRLDRITAAGAQGPEVTGELVAFELMPWPRWTFSLGSDAADKVTREVLLDRKSSRVMIRWSTPNSSGNDLDRDPLQLEVSPYLPFREADDLTFHNLDLDPQSSPLATEGWDLRRIHRPYAALPALEIAASALHAPVAGRARWVDGPHWLRGVELNEDRARGYEWHEDRFSPGSVHVTLGTGATLVLALGVAESSASGAQAQTPMRMDAEALWSRLAEEAHERWESARSGRSSALALHWRAADDFLFSTAFDAPAVSPPDGSRKPRSEPDRRIGILAGFPWFGEWGRDVFLSLPGLTLARGDLGNCRAVLLGALPFLRNGLLPNIYAASPADSHYGSVDASLWFARAARLFRLAGGDGETCRGPLRRALAEIHRSYRTGGVLGIQPDPGGLILAGSPGLNPTWMDAQTSRGPVTPRAGCPVEIAALWILLLEERLALEEEASEIESLTLALERAQSTFRRRFWSEQRGHLADLWTPEGTDFRLRPNMVLAAAMETTPLEREERLRLLGPVEAELLTPVGLRTLSPSEAAYRGRYRGGPEERDGAYHQGTVWPWLLGSYVELCLAARGHSRSERERLGALLDGVDRELLRAGLGHVSEVFDGDPPHDPGGTIAQAWNTAELLRARALTEAP